MCACLDLYTARPTEPHLLPRFAPQQPKSVRVYVFSHGWHTGIVMQAGDIKKLTSIDWLDQLTAGDSDYLEFGWGDEQAYRVKVVRTGTIMKAMFLPTKSVVHLERFNEPPYVHYSDSQLETFDVTPAQLESMLSVIEKTISKDASGKLLNIGSGVEADSTFFRAKKLYFIGRSCNMWTAKVLKAGGINARSLFAPKLMEKLRQEVDPVR